MSRYEVEVKINMNDNWGMYECKNTANIELTDFICRVRDIIGGNPYYNVLTTLPETSEQSSLCVITKVIFDDNSGYFPGILTEKRLIAYDPEDGLQEGRGLCAFAHLLQASDVPRGRRRGRAFEDEMCG